MGTAEKDATVNVRGLERLAYDVERSPFLALTGMTAPRVREDRVGSRAGRTPCRRQQAPPR